MADGAESLRSAAAQKTRRTHGIGHGGLSSRSQCSNVALRAFAGISLLDCQQRDEQKMHCGQSSGGASAGGCGGVFVREGGEHSS